jgi:pyrroline-5-carboxylate reductase
MTKIAFLGAGAMGTALLRGLIKAGVYQPADIGIYDVDAPRVLALSQELGVTAHENVSDFAAYDAILLAVKPQIVESALAPLGRLLTPNHTLISIAAGVSLSQLEACFDAAVPCVRVMPNTPCLIGQAASAIALGQHAGDDARVLAHRVFDVVGLALDVPETQLDAVTGLSGSGPAYVYIFIEALSDAGVKMGLPRDTATRLAAQTVLGSAQMVLETDTHPGALKDMVTSPGGTTIAGVHALENRAFRATIIDAVEAATKRSKELGAR